VWGVPLSANYSANETGIIALQCREGGRYHAQSETIFLELLGEDGAPCRPGETGRVVVTDLHNFVMPLIRYDIGDYAVWADGCPCGRGLPALARIAGRTRNMFVRPNGEKFWPTALKAEVYKALAPARQIQIVQRTPSRLDVRLVSPAPLDAAAENVVRQRITEAIGYPFELHFNYVEEIPRSRGGKFEDCVSEVAEGTG
jgi:phenylacetate-CoA ligase